MSKRLSDICPALTLVAWQNVFKFVRRGHFDIMYIPIQCTLVTSGHAGNLANICTPYKSGRTDITMINARNR